MTDIKVGEPVWKIRVRHKGRKFEMVSYMIRNKYELWNALRDHAEIIYEQKPASKSDLNVMGLYTYRTREEAEAKVNKTLEEIRHERYRT